MSPDQQYLVTTHLRTSVKIISPIAQDVREFDSIFSLTAGRFWVTPLGALALVSTCLLGSSVLGTVFPVDRAFFV